MKDRSRIPDLMLEEKLSQIAKMMITLVDIGRHSKTRSILICERLNMYCENIQMQEARLGNSCAVDYAANINILHEDYLSNKSNQTREIESN